MSKYKVGDKVVMEITDRFKNAYGHEYYSILDSVYSTEFIDEKSEPLRNYTEPLEAKIKRQAAEITRLLEENKRLKAENGNSLWNIEQARAEGQNEAWELARKIVLKNGYSAYDLHEVFNCCGSHQAMENFTYPEAAAKVAEWEKAKEEEHATAERRQKVIEAAKVIKEYCNISNCFSCPIDCEESPHPFGWKIGGESDEK